ncbi:MAG: hypothetical protein AAGC81_01265 [Pseudomonadota bacterium]
MTAVEARTPPMPPRLYGLLAREAPVGVLIRRGPRRLCPVYHWDLERDRIRLGQWLGGVIDPKSADLSPDGRHWIYRAQVNANGRRAAGADCTYGEWIAVAKAGWLKALDFHVESRCVGGVLLDNSRYVIESFRMPRQLYRHSPLTQVVARPEAFGKTLSIPQHRDLRDGWRQVDKKRFERDLRGGWYLRKRSGGPIRDGGRDTRYSLVFPGDRTELEQDDWDWADRRGNDLLYSSQGRVWRRRMLENDNWSAPTCLIDLNGTGIERRCAPH